MLLGTEPGTGHDVRLRMGPHGPYLQTTEPVTSEAGSTETKGGKRGKKKSGPVKVRNVALPPEAATSTLTLEVPPDSYLLLCIPRDLPTTAHVTPRPILARCASQ